MPTDVYLTTTNYSARPCAGPGMLCMPQLVPQGCPWAGQSKEGGRERGLLTLSLPLPGVQPLSTPPSHVCEHWQ